MFSFYWCRKSSETATHEGWLLMCYCSGLIHRSIHPSIHLPAGLGRFSGVGLQGAAAWAGKPRLPSPQTSCSSSARIPSQASRESPYSVSWVFRGPPAGGTCLEHVTREAFRRHLPHLNLLSTEEQRLFSEFLPDGRASHPMSKGRPGHHTEEAHFSRSYPRSRSFGQYPTLVISGWKQRWAGKSRASAFGSAPSSPRRTGWSPALVFPRSSTRYLNSSTWDRISSPTRMASDLEKLILIPRADLVHPQGQATEEVYNHLGNFSPGDNRAQGEVWWGHRERLPDGFKKVLDHRQQEGDTVRSGVGVPKMPDRWRECFEDLLTPSHMPSGEDRGPSKHDFVIL